MEYKTEEYRRKGGKIASTPDGYNSCVVCLGARESTWIFLPCKHANCCEKCTQTITQMGNTCPTCKTPIVDTFKNFLS